MSASIRVKRGLYSNLPADAPVGELLATTDTQQLFIGDGTGNALIEMCPAGSGGGGSGVAISRYEIGGSGSKSYVHATGAVGDVTLNVTGNVATLAATNGAHIFSVSIYFTSVQMTGQTKAIVNFGSNTPDAGGNIAGTGDNSSYNTIFPPQWMVWTDGSTPATKVVKTVATGVLNNNGASDSQAITFGNLTSTQAIWINLTF
jgi:hypothetical protein